jgi:hemoglobin
VLSRAWRHAGRIAAALLMVVAASCSAHRSNDAAGSGDPEADQRANQRLGTTDEAGGAGDNKARTLYERIGGEKVITALVDDMVARSIADPRVNFERHDIKTGLFSGKYPEWQPSPGNVQTLKQHMVEFLTLAAGGPAQYTGREMREVHKGMKITNSEFDAMVGDAKASMDRLGIPTREKRDMLAIIETTRKQIVEK